MENNNWLHRKETDTHILTIRTDEDCESPRSWSNLGKMIVRDHRQYAFPKEYPFDFDLYDENDVTEMKALKKYYWVFGLDCYIHSGVSFSLGGEGMRCRFDTSTNVGFLIIPKQYNGYDQREIHATLYTPEDEGKYLPQKVSKKKAEEIARGELELYNQWSNGGIYTFMLEKKIALRREDGTLSTEYETEMVDSCGDIYAIRDIANEFVTAKEYPELNNWLLTIS